MQVSWDCLMGKMMDERQDVTLSKILVQDLDIKPESANELLDFLAYHSQGLENIVFIKWKETVSSIEKEVLIVLAEKSVPTLKSLTIKTMQSASEPVREALAHMVLRIIKSSPM